MTLDPRTIVIVNLITAAILGLGMLAVSRSYMRQIAGLRFWGLASLLHSFGWLLTALRDFIPDFFSILCGQAALLLSVAFYFKVIASYTRSNRKNDWVYMLVFITMLLQSFYLYVYPNTAIRIFIISVSSSTLLLASAYVLFRGKERKSPARLFTGIVFAFSGIVFAFRAFYYLFWDNSPNQVLFAQNTIQGFSFLTSYLAAVMLTFGFLLISYDLYIYQHEEIESKLMLSEKLLSESQRLAKIGSWEYNFDTKELIWSKEQYHIFEMEEAPPDKLFELCRAKIHPDDLAKMDEAIAISRETGKGVVYEHRVICKDGSIKHLIGTGDIYVALDGKTKMLRGTVQDVTEQKKAEETNRRYAILQSKSKEMEQFAYIASHDLREPLLTIKNYVELFTEETKGKLNEEMREYLFRISRASVRMDELIRGLLDYSRLSKVKELQDVDTGKLVREVLADLNLLIINNSATVEVKGLPVVRGYPLELKQLFQNLIANAIKFRNKQENPKICIGAQISNGVWTFEVCDNGIGIPKTEHEKIFALFQRIHNKNEYAGSGIGLAICKKIVELHHGTIWVDSTPGAGSKFYFTIAA